MNVSAIMERDKGKVGLVCSNFRRKGGAGLVRGSGERSRLPSVNANEIFMIINILGVIREFRHQMVRPLMVCESEVKSI